MHGCCCHMHKCPCALFLLPFLFLSCFFLLFSLSLFFSQSRNSRLTSTRRERARAAAAAGLPAARIPLRACPLRALAPRHHARCTRGRQLCTGLTPRPWVPLFVHVALSEWISLSALWDVYGVPGAGLVLVCARSTPGSAAVRPPACPGCARGCFAGQAATPTTPKPSMKKKRRDKTTRMKRSQRSGHFVGSVCLWRVFFTSFLRCVCLPACLAALDHWRAKC